MKPRISKARGFETFMGAWKCASLQGIGYGRTPKDACDNMELRVELQRQVREMVLNMPSDLFTHSPNVPKHCTYIQL